MSWTSDGRGSPDSLLFTATAAPQSPIVQNRANPLFPVTLSVTWQEPVPGDSMVTQGCAKVKRRGLLSSQACSVRRTYRGIDVPPPPPVVDTTLQIATIWIDPRGLLTVAQTDSLELCRFMQFRDGVVAISTDAQVGACAVRLTRYQAGRRPTAAQQAMADTSCRPLPGMAPWAVVLRPGDTGPIGRLTVLGLHRAWLHGS